MNILRPGNKELILSPIKTFECQRCYCLFEADKDEWESITQYNETNYMCQCPECEEWAHETK